MTKQISRLDVLEAESLHTFHQAAARFRKPVLLYSVDKESTVLLHLARKVFFPRRVPFPLLHIDTTWKFRDMIAFRDRTARELGLDLIVHINEEGRARGINPIDYAAPVHKDVMKVEALRQALDRHGFDAALGGHLRAPRHRDPEMSTELDGRLDAGESVRVSPLSNWTEGDIWRYVLREKLDVVPLYLAAVRPTIERNGRLIVVDDDRIRLAEGEKIVPRRVRFRTLGCWPLTPAVASNAADLLSVVTETLAARTSEKQGF